MNNDTEMDASQNSQSTPPTITENVSYKVRSHLKNLILSIKDKYFPPIKVLIDESYLVFWDFPYLSLLL